MAIDIDKVIRLHDRTVAEWHRSEIENDEEKIYRVVLDEHAANFQLWHAEDEARRTDVDESYIALQKRTIDKWNQRRNDLIEKIDEEIIGEWPWVIEDESLPINTETPGSVVDRLSISSLKIYHMDEELARTDVSEEHIETCRQKATRLRKQRTDLAHALDILLDELKSRKKRLQVYRQFKMYNDPNLNQAVYRSK